MAELATPEWVWRFNNPLLHSKLDHSRHAEGKEEYYAGNQPELATCTRGNR
jgi:hypothetical protein